MTTGSPSFRHVFAARLRWAWRMKEWPWRVPHDVVYLAKPTRRDLERAEELAREMGWDDV